jgi:hypothetical protein
VLVELCCHFVCRRQGLYQGAVVRRHRQPRGRTRSELRPTAPETIMRQTSRKTDNPSYQTPAQRKQSSLAEHAGFGLSARHLRTTCHEKRMIALPARTQLRFCATRYNSCAGYQQKGTEDDPSSVAPDPGMTSSPQFDARIIGPICF